MMKAKELICFCTGLLFCLTTSAWGKDDLPKSEPFAHYEPMVKRSPFAVATASAPVGSKPDFAKDLYVANAAHSTDGDFVTIASTTDKNLKEYLNTRETVDGYSISNIQWSDRVGETKVTISKDGQFATLTFNEALLSQGIQNPAVQPQADFWSPACACATEYQCPDADSAADAGAANSHATASYPTGDSATRGPITAEFPESDRAGGR